MNRYVITEAQLDELVSLNLEYIADIERQQELVKEIKLSPLVPVERIREAAQRAWGQSQSLAGGPIAVTDHSTQLPAAE